ncbi:MAG: IPT/TIG domain-containing protein [Deltaproteobacteria bacterium]|nr:IPT/TIG domain-containing protein [Deltaproteobacteria bacterium]
MLMPQKLWTLAASVMVVAIHACSPPVGIADAGEDVAIAQDSGPVFEDVGASDGGRADSGRVSNPVLLAVRPDHGPFLGGNTVTLRGSNFREGLTVRFGDAMVQPRAQRLVDGNRIEVGVPSGMPGVVDVVIEGEGFRSRLPMAYTYDAFYVDPSTGSIAGGARITLRGQSTAWTMSSTVAIDGAPCADMLFVSPSELQCTVPPHAQGSVPVTVTTGLDATTVTDAFSYYEASDPNNGGFGGGSIRGSINVAVLNYLTGDAIPTAFVYLGNAPAVLPPQSGITNMRGQVTLSAADLRGPVTITATARCFASSTFVSIDGRDATMFLIPYLNRVPGVDCGEGMPPEGPPRPPVFAATIEGELVWSGPREFGPNRWDNIPPARANERRVAYVMTTTSNIFGGNPDPGMGGVVLENLMTAGRLGFPYRIVARPAALAVYAIAGLERMDTTPPRFTPYVMGVARSVLGSPRATVPNVNIDMNIPLDHETSVVLSNLPDQTMGQPNQFRVENWIDLGGEGVIPRPDVRINRSNPTDPFRLVAQPAFLGTLSDARMIVRAAYGTGTSLEAPESTVLMAGITTPDDTVNVRNWVGIPRIVEPGDGGMLSATRRIAIEQNGANPDFFWSVISQSGSSCNNGFYLGDVVWWQHHFPGATREIGVPDISMVPTLSDMPRGLYQLSVCGIRVQGFDYNNFNYRWLNRFYWTAYSANVVTIAR